MRKNSSHSGPIGNSPRDEESLLSDNYGNVNSESSLKSEDALDEDPPFANKLFFKLRQQTVHLVKDMLPKVPKVFSQSKTPVKLAVLSGNIESALKLIEEGYPVSPKIIFEPILKKNSDIIKRIISSKIYDKRNTSLAFWLLVKFEMIEESKMLLETEELLKEFVQDPGDLSNSANILNNNNLLLSAFDQALEFGIDFAACLLIKQDYQLASLKRIERALDTGCVNFLKIIWTGDLEKDEDSITDVKVNSEIVRYLSTKYGKVEDLEILKRQIDPSKLLGYYLEHGRVDEARKIMNWTILRNSQEVLFILIENSDHDLGGEYLLKSTLTVKPEQFLLALSKQKYDTCLIMLRRIRGKLEIKEIDIQKKIIELLGNSFTCLLAIEFLIKLKIRYWKVELTRALCSALSSLIRKSRSFMFCKDILLFSVLVVVIMEKFKNRFKKYQDKCKNVMMDYLQLSVHLIEETADEETLKYHLLTKSASGKTVLELIAKHNLLKLLESDTLGIIVYKLWNGSESNSSIYAASSLYKMIISPLGTDGSVQFMKGIDMSVPYHFQLVNIKEACSTRFLGQSSASFALIVLYYIFLFYLVENENFLHFREVPLQKNLFAVIVMIVLGITAEQVLNLIYYLKEKGKIEVDAWKVNNWLIALLIFFISIDLPESAYNLGWVRYDSAYLASSIINSIMFFMLCNKFWDISKTYHSFGPLVSLCFTIFKNSSFFLLIYLGVIFCSSGVFTLLFMQTPGYESLDYSFRTLVMVTIGPFDISNFSENKIIFGALTLALFQLISHILLLNLLVGVVESIYTNFRLNIESEYRSILIKKFYENEWSDSYGVLIFLPYPFNIFSLIVSPFVLIGKNKWNEYFTQVFYLAYAVPFLVIFIIINFICLPFCYLKGFLVYGKTGKMVPMRESIKIFNVPEGEKKLVLEFSVLKSLAWTVIGPFWLVFACVRDCVQFWKVGYLEAPIRDLNEDPVELVDERLLKSIIKALGTFPDEKITADELFQKFKELDGLCNESSDNRDEKIAEILTQISIPNSKENINSLMIRRLFIKKIGGFDEREVARFRYFNLSFVCKALMLYRKSYESEKELKWFKMKRELELEEFNNSIWKVETKVAEVKEKVEKLISSCIEISIKARNYRKKQDQI